MYYFIANTEPHSYICLECIRMKIKLITVGKTDFSWIKEGLSMYTSRLVHYVPFTVLEIPELKNVSSLSKEQIKEKEALLILDQLKSNEELILLDEKAKQFRSIEFASFIETRLNYSSKDIIFVIGGAYGFSEKVYKRANYKLSLSNMTFSHQLVRLIFIEQLYRAFTILRGEPYHHE